MGMWSTIGKTLLKAAPLVAAPFTAGTSLAWMPAALGAAGAAVGSMGEAASANRGEQDKLNLNRDSIGLSANNSFENAQQGRARLELDQRGDSREEQQQAFLLALKSALAKNMQDVSIDRSQFRTRVPNISFAGGARPSALGPEGREAASVMSNAALQTLLSPSKHTELPPVERFQQSEPSKASFWEKLAGPLGMGLTVAGQVMGQQPQGLDPLPQVVRRPITAGGPIAGMPRRQPLLEDEGDFTLGRG